ncbi:MAG: SpoIIE family protein phosphatase [Acidimicrobiia bacterium]|nr:SpoIIE family protein phosphatase [Acidimicrobiia bacterium]
MGEPAASDPVNPTTEDRLRLALDAGGLGTWQWDRHSGAVSWDDRLEELFGLEPGEFDGSYQAWMSMIHPDDRADTLAVVEAAMTDGGTYTVHHRVVCPDESIRWIEGRGKVFLDEAGEPAGTIGYAADVTDRMEDAAEREVLIAQLAQAADRDRLQRERLEFLMRINDALRLSADSREVMARVAAAAVPRLGEWCVVYLVPETGGPPEVEVGHSDNERAALARSLRERFPYDPAARNGVAAVLRTGETVFVPELTDEDIDALDAPVEARDAIKALRLRSTIIVPISRGRSIIGALQFATEHGNRAYDPSDVALAESVATRVASTLDHLRLSGLHREISTTLQHSLLPVELPEVPGLEVAVRYWAAGEATEVGGDFYDVFPIAQGRWGVAIGDVCGTGPGAAAVTGLARHTIRCAAWHGDEPSDVLTQLNQALRASYSDSFVTAVYGELRDEGRTVTFALAGHPLPVWVRPTRGALAAGVPGSLLGPFEEPTFTEQSLELGEGDVVVLYTDGVSDVAPPHGLTEEEVVDLVRDVVATASSAEEVADGLHERIAARLPIERRDDDIALLVLRRVAA